MNVRCASDWEKIHFDSSLVDLHAHPSVNISLFHGALSLQICSSRSAFDPFILRIDFARLQKRGVDAMPSVMHAPEKGILKTKGGNHVSHCK